MKPTKNERLRRHFAVGGAALNHLDIAAMFDISAANASRLITHLEYNNKKWQVTIERRPQRMVTGLKLRATPEQEMREQVRAEMLANPQANDNSIKVKLGCSCTLVRGVRKIMIAAGEAEKLDGRKGPASKAEAKPSRRWADEEQHLAASARFREIWKGGLSA